MAIVVVFPRVIDRVDILVVRREEFPLVYPVEIPVARVAVELPAERRGELLQEAPDWRVV